jgi:hypothetical protein
MEKDKSHCCYGLPLQEPGPTERETAQPTGSIQGILSPFSVGGFIDRFWPADSESVEKVQRGS